MKRALLSLPSKASAACPGPSLRIRLKRDSGAKPTVINNVETLAAVPYIILRGAEEFRKYGSEQSPGTKTFALTGDVANTGLIEVPMGLDPARSGV